MESNVPEKDLGDMVDSRMNTSQQMPLWKEAGL